MVADVASVLRQMQAELVAAMQSSVEAAEAGAVQAVEAALSGASCSGEALVGQPPRPAGGSVATDPSRGAGVVGPSGFQVSRRNCR